VLIKHEDGIYFGIGMLDSKSLLTIFLALFLLPIFLYQIPNLLYQDEDNPLSFIDIASGADHTCAILDNGNVSCWGGNYHGQIGIISTSDTQENGFILNPTQTMSLGGGRNAIEVSAGQYYTCALLDDGNVSCWGLDSFGQHGDGSFGGNHYPAQTSSLGESRTAVKISTGSVHTCAILDDGTVSCWGSNVGGLLGDGSDDTSFSEARSAVPIQTSSLGGNRTAVEIALGSNFACAILDDGTVSCWGNNQYGQLGDGDNWGNSSSHPNQTASLGEGRTAVKISAGYHHVCAILDDGNVSCWGYNYDGQIGYGSDTVSSVFRPTLTASLGEGRTAIEISSGASHTCVILDDGTVSCWGRGMGGRLGNGGISDRNTPTQTSSFGNGLTAVEISAGWEHTCAIFDDKSMSCWGDNFAGNLGDGTLNSRNTPFITQQINYSFWAIYAIYLLILGSFFSQMKPWLPLGDRIMIFEARKKEAGRLEAGRLLAERLEAERLEAERLEAGRLEAERLEAERLEAERLEAERLEAERLEAERLEELEIARIEKILEKRGKGAGEILKTEKSETRIQQEISRRELIDRGGMADVFIAEHKSTGEKLIWKQASPNQFNPLSEVNRRLLDESSLLEKMSHPRIPRKIDQGEIINDSGQKLSVLVMEFIEGSSLKQEMDTFVSRGINLSLPQTINNLIEICEALEYMADSDPPLYHRDVKPANIIVHPERGSVLIDFGLSKGVSAGQDVSMSRGASEGWSPPERRDGVSGPFTDVYSLGQIMWHLLTGKRPFHVIGEDEESIITNLGHPAWVVDLMRMCSLPYKKRIQTVVEFRMRIENEGRL